MIVTAYVNIGGWLIAKLDNGQEQNIGCGLELQGFTSAGVTYKDNNGWIKVWHENGSTERIA